MPIAATGQTERQAPQPVQASSLSSGKKGPPARGRKRIASVGQASRQAWQSVRFLARQLSPIIATCGNCRDWPVKTGSGQSSAHWPQKVHSATKKSSAGRSAISRMMWVGQASTHRPQPVQASRPSGVAPAEGHAHSPACENRGENSAVIYQRPRPCRPQCAGGPGGPKMIWNIQTRKP